MSLLLSSATGLLAVVGTGIAIVAWWAAARSRKPRLAVFAGGFTIFALAGWGTAIQLYRGSDAEAALTLQSLLLAAGLVMVYFASVKR